MVLEKICIGSSLQLFCFFSSKPINKPASLTTRRYTNYQTGVLNSQVIKRRSGFLFSWLCLLKKKKNRRNDFLFARIFLLKKLHLYFVHMPAFSILTSQLTGMSKLARKLNFKRFTNEFRFLITTQKLLKRCADRMEINKSGC